MRNLSKFEVFSEFKKYSFYFVDCSKIGVDRKMLLSLYDEFTEFCKRFHITIEKLIVYIDKLGILNKDLFDFSAYGSKESYLFAKNAIYTTKYVTEYGCQKKVVTKYNVYVVPNLYVNLALSKIAREVVLDVFPFLNDDVFCGKQRRFKDNINGLPVNLNTLVDDIDAFILFNNKITIGDLIKLYTDKTYKDSYVKKCNFSVYEDGKIFLNVEKESSLYVMIDDLFNKDWTAIENREVQSIPLYDENGVRIPYRWYDGIQKNAPYFNNEIVRKFKECLFEQR